MAKFTLIAEHTNLDGVPDGTKVNYEFHGTYLPEILDHVELFLRGCGFCPNGTLDFIPTDELLDSARYWSDEKDTNIDIEHSESYYDTERNK